MAKASTFESKKIRATSGARRWLCLVPGWLTILCLLLAGQSFAQPLSNLVFSVGTTIQDIGGNNWSYVLIGSAESQLVLGKQYGVYGKAGFPTNNVPFTQRGLLFQQTDVTAINTLLNQSIALNENLASLNDALNTLLHKTPNITNQSVAQKIAISFQQSITDASVAQSVWLLSGLHPGLKMCLGLAFAEKITGTTTYEIRELAPGTGAPGDVLGRVTITPGAAVVLPAPGPPFQVTTNDPSDHLRIRLRWGTPDSSRRLSLLQYGFNLWRIPTSAASAYITTPPTVAQLNSDTNFLRVNPAPVMALKDYDTLSGASDPTDRTTYFFSDNNGRLYDGTHSFADGATFYYFVTARDILGRDGLASPGGSAIACRRIPPLAPTKPQALNIVQVLPVTGGTTNQQRIQVLWNENINAADAVSEYWVYRWANPSMALTNDAVPLTNRIGVVPHVSTTNRNSFIDANADSPSAPGPLNYWYTIRAVSQAACGPLLSAHSTPVSAVLRERGAPAATTGELLSSCGTPIVVFQGLANTPNPNSPNTNFWNYRITCVRRDPSIASVRIQLRNFTSNSTNNQVIGPLYFPPDGNSISVDYPVPVYKFQVGLQITCSVSTYYNEFSTPVVYEITPPSPTNQIIEATFLAGNLLLTGLSSTDPLLTAINPQETCYPPDGVARDPSGTVHLRFNTDYHGPLMIQYATNLNATLAWTDIGVATADTNGVYSVYLCPCVIGPINQFRGCTVNFPTDGTCDQHVARTGDGGTVAPILVRFHLTLRTHEYRLYRSVDDGPPTLISQAAALFDPANPNNEIVRTDDAMPPSAARLCYYVQTLDENGNGSPLALIGCRDVVPPKPPRPVLSEPTPIGNTSNPQVALNWFCPTSGVYRFEVRIQRADEPMSGKPTGFTSALLISPPSALLSTRGRYLGLLADRALSIAYDESLLTPPIGASFGPGPQFSLTASVVPNVPYHISVAAENRQGNWGDSSQDWMFVWKPPSQLQTVPWPARPLPAVQNFDGPVSGFVSNAVNPRVRAVLMTDPNFQLDQHYPVGIRVGDLTGIRNSSSTQRTTNLVSYFYTSADPSKNLDPNNLIFQRMGPSDPTKLGQSLLPIVVYRQQVTNAAFLHVSGNVTQVTPLMEHLPFTITKFGDFTVITIMDPLIGSSYESYLVGSQPMQSLFMYVRDQQPVMLGASYQYFVARFDTNHEVSEVIPAGVVTIPASIP